MDRSFCLTGSTFRRYTLSALLLCLAFSLIVPTVYAQGRRGFGGRDFGGRDFGGGRRDSGGGFDSSDFLLRFDQDGNGRLDSGEVPDRMREMMESQGMDLSRGVSTDDFQRARDRMRQQISGGDGDRRGSDDDDDEDDRDFRGRFGSDDGRRSFFRRDGDQDEEQTKKERARVTFDLPDSHADADSDGDGQLGMYEWRRNGRSLNDFFELDGNGDGFVTAREVYLVIGFPESESDDEPQSDNPIASRFGGFGNGSFGDGSFGEGSFGSGRFGNSEGGTPAATDSGDRRTASAIRYFGILDKDDDGAISEEEWGSSVRIRGMFEEAGLDLSEPMSQDAFVGNYVRLSD